MWWRVICAQRKIDFVRPVIAIISRQLNLKDKLFFKLCHLITFSWDSLILSWALLELFILCWRDFWGFFDILPNSLKSWCIVKYSFESVFHSFIFCPILKHNTRFFRGSLETLCYSFRFPWPPASTVKDSFQDSLELFEWEYHGYILVKNKRCI